MNKQRMIKTKQNNKIKDVLINLMIIKFFAYCFIFPIIFPEFTFVSYVMFLVSSVAILYVYLKIDVPNLWRKKNEKS